MLHQIVLSILLFAASNTLAFAQVVDGSIDLSGQDKEIVYLHSTWNFYPHILQPSEIASVEKESITVPGSWTLGTRFKKYGYGIYHIKLEAETKELLALRLDKVPTVYRVWVRGDLIEKTLILRINSYKSAPPSQQRLSPFYTELK